MATVSSQSAPPCLHSCAEACEVLLPLLLKYDTFLVTSHARPDGDAVGSALGTMHLLEALKKRVFVCFADPVPTPFASLPGADRIAYELPETLIDVAVVLECDSVERTGYPSLPGRHLINIDHHQSGIAYGELNWIDPEAPAVGVMVYDLAVRSGAPLGPALASCLYAAILTDTVGFTLPTTTAVTFDIARHLLELGADAAAISNAVYFSQRESKVRLLGAALRGLQVRGPVAWSAVTQADMDALEAGVEDSEGIVQHLIALREVRAAALLRELPGGAFLRASLRSKGGVNVAHVAESFGGGGHRNASGCTVAGPLQDAVRRIETALQAACQEPGSTA